MAIRNLPAGLRSALLTEESFVYAHLVKFERPITTTSGKSSRKAKDYIYITDGSIDIEWDDGTEDINGNNNGSQTYIANKLLKVGGVSETVEARATSINLQIAANALSTEAEGLTVTIDNTTTPKTLEITDNNGGTDEACSFTNIGFREGDLIEIIPASGTWNKNAVLRIDRFTDNNTKIEYTVIDGTINNTTGSATGIGLYFKSPEVEGIISDRSASGYARYINRDVFIYKVFLNPETGAFYGDPYLLFKGIVAGGKINEDPTKGSTVSWNLTSHWGDFARVQGRLTSDPHHRALDQNNVPDPEAAIKPSYTSDLGFLHSEQAVNLVAIYQVKETRTKMKMKRKWYGSKKYKLIEYQVEVDREADLRFNLEAKYLPVVYGVNKIDSIPVFVDTLNNDAKQVFVAYAICEGQIGGLYDIYFDDTSSICIDENDQDTRSTQTSENTIDVLCQGRADRGDVLTSQIINSSTSATALPSAYAWGSDSWDENRRSGSEIYYRSYPYFTPLEDTSITGGASSTGAGITHEKGTKFTTPIDAVLTFHAGLPNQKANSTLLANASNFKVGTDYYSGSDPYWGAQHQLLDTAYVVAKYTIGEGETTIPSLDFVVRGKGVNCYNYDFSYAQDPAYPSDDSSNFEIGQEVTVKSTTGDLTLNSNAVIADIYTITDLDGNLQTRIRFKEDPDTTAFTAFYITDGTNSFHLVKWNDVRHSGTVPSALQEQITSVGNTTVTEGTGVDVTVGSGNPSASLDFALEYGDYYAIVSALEESGFSREEIDQIYGGVPYTTGSGTVQDLGETQTSSGDLVDQYVTVMDAIQLGSGASATNDAYNNLYVEVTHTYEDNSVLVQTRKIKDYDGSTKVAILTQSWEQAPKQNDTYRILSDLPDIRVTTNPAMQLLDYLTSERYGRNLDLDNDIDKESFFRAGRDCDTRSNVTVLSSSAAPSIGDFYKYEANGKTVFHGRVKNITTVGAFKSIEFDQVLGKLCHRWENWKYFYTGELYYHNGGLHKASSNGVISTAPSTTSSVSATDVQLSKVSGDGPTTLQLDYNSTRVTFEGNPVVKIYTGTQTNNGYSLYDSDDVKYWRYLGWEAQNQRHVTRHQTNAIIDTAAPVFDNINSMLKHFNGILRYSAGLYSLAVMQQADSAASYTINSETYKPEEIDEGDIIGSIAVEDAGQKGTYNQVDVGINDPQNRFEGRSVMMFNSDYLKQDRMVPRKGNFQAPYVTNYYNARMNAKQYLDQSRSGLKISFTMGPKGALLLAGEIIRITYPRFGWTNKYYRITNLTVKEDCLVQIVAEEHDDSTFAVDPTNAGAIKSTEGIGANPAGLEPPTGLSATTDKFGGVVLSWTNSANFKTSSYSTQIWRSDDNDRTNAVLIDVTKASTYTDPIVEGGTNSKYYWIRHIALVPPQTGSQVGLKELNSEYEPAEADGGVLGTSGDIRSQRVDLTVNQGVVAYDVDGANPDVASVTLTASVQGFNDPYFKFTGGGSQFTDETDWTDGATDTSDTATFTLPTSYFSTPYNFTVEVKEGGTGDVLASDTTSVAAIKPGAGGEDGAGALLVYLDNPAHTVNASNNGTVADFGNAGTTISVYEGVTQLDYDGVGTTDGHWTVTATGTNITPDSITEDGDNAVLGDDPSNMTANNAKITLSITGKRLDGTSFSLEAQQSISKARDGSNGSDAKTVVLRASEYTISYDADGANPDTSSITLTADSYNFDDAYFKFTGGGSAFTDETAWTDGSSQNQDTATFTVPTSYSSTPYNFTVEVKEGSTGNVIATDTLTIASLKPGSNGDPGDDGVDALTLILTNPAHTIPEGTDGNLSYTGSGTTIQLFEGVTELDYDGAGTTNGHWTVTATGTNITAGTISDSTNYAVVANASSMTEDTASISYSITGKRQDGTAISLTAIQSFARANRGASGTDSKVVNLRADSQIISYDSSGANPSPSSITLTADSVNFVDGYFKFTGGGDDFTDESSWTNGTGANTDTATFTTPTSYSSTPYTFTVSVKEGSTGDVIATDTITVASIQPGSDAQNQKTVFVFKKGDSTLGFATGKSAADQSFANPTNGLESGWSTTQPALSADGDTVYMSQRLFTSDAASPQEASWSTPVVVAKRTDGTGGDDGQSVKFVQLFKKNDSTFTPGSTATYANPTNGVESGWTTSVPALSADGDKVYMVSRTFTSDGQSPQDSSWTDPVIVAQRTDGDPGDDGADALTVILSNENHAVPQNESGTLDFTGSGTSIRLFEGTVELDYDGAGTTNGHWTVSVSDTNVTSAASPFTESGNQVNVSAITAFASGQNTGNRTFTITGKRANGTAISIDKVQTFVRTVDGSNGDDGVDGVSLNMTATQVVFNKDGSTYDPAGTSTITLSAFGGTITGVTYTDNRTYLATSSTSNSGCVATFSNNLTKAQVEQANTITAAVTGTTSDGTTGVSFGSITVDIPTVINGSDGSDGDPGLRTVQGYLYYEKTTANAPSAPVGNTYTFSSGAVSGSGIGTGTNVWTNEPRTQDPTSSNTHYIIRYYGTESAANSSTVTVSYSSVAQYTNFTDVVTFSNGTFQDGGTNITTIDGGNISTGTIKADQLHISSGSSTASSMFFDGDNNRIDIKDSGGVLRVRIGNLG